MKGRKSGSQCFVCKNYRIAAEAPATGTGIFQGFHFEWRHLVLQTGSTLNILGSAHCILLDVEILHHPKTPNIQ